MQAIDHYRRTGKNPTMLSYREATVDEYRNASGHVKILTRQGTIANAKVNGKPQTWKTRNDVRVPLKYGMYEFFDAWVHDGKSDGVIVVVID